MKGEEKKKRKKNLQDTNFFSSWIFYENFLGTIKLRLCVRKKGGEKKDKRFMSRCLWQIFSGFSFSFEAGFWYTNLSCTFSKRHCKLLFGTLNRICFVIGGKFVEHSLFYASSSILCLFNSFIEWKSFEFLQFRMPQVVNFCNTFQLVGKTFSFLISQST